MCKYAITFWNNKMYEIQESFGISPLKYFIFIFISINESIKFKKKYCFFVWISKINVYIYKHIFLSIKKWNMDYAWNDMTEKCKNLQK